MFIHFDMVDELRAMCPGGSQQGLVGGIIWNSAAVEQWKMAGIPKNCSYSARRKVRLQHLPFRSVEANKNVLHNLQYYRARPLGIKPQASALRDWTVRLAQGNG